MMPKSPQHTSWISHPLLGFQSITTNCGRTMEIQCPPSPYHLTIDSSTQIVPPGVNHSSQCLLKAATKPSTNPQRYVASDIPYGRTACCSLNHTLDKRASNWWRFILVLLILGATPYFVDGDDFYISLCGISGIRGISRMILKNLINSSCDVGK